ncbi:MAG: isoaspartyl peptidase/L-asparaginase family protein [Campylobacteraceae bacterium]
MRMSIFSKLIFGFLVACLSFATLQAKDVVPVMVIHSGTSGLGLTEEEFSKRAEAMKESLKAGQAVLIRGGTAEEAVIAAIKVMEDNPIFNAGKGAVFNADGENELDASIMDGKTKKAGAVAGAKHIKNPIEAAKLVKDKTWHTLIAGDGADALAKQYGLEMVDQHYFFTQNRYDSYLKAKEKEEKKSFIDHEKIDAPKKTSSADLGLYTDPYLGTVGALALDKEGNLAAGTSTGGMTNKMKGRIGDSPIIGSGTYADNDGLAISCTGSGDIFMRVNAAHEANVLYKYKKLTPTKAAEGAIQQVADLDGRGGIISLNAKGETGFAWTKDKLGMYHGYARGNAEPVVVFPVAK